MASSPPSLIYPSSEIPAPERTNTLILTSLPASFFAPVVLDVLRTFFESYGPLHAWAPLKGFGRIIMVYYSEDDAEVVKQCCDTLMVSPAPDSPEIMLRVYRADPTPISSSSNPDIYLHPPEHEKNFLISPPGSPPVGWEPIREEPPNSTPLADDLIHALEQLRIRTEQQASKVGVATLLEPDDGPGIGVYVEDCDGGEDGVGSQETDWAYGETSPARMQWGSMRTAMPPMTVGA